MPCPKRARPGSWDESISILPSSPTSTANDISGINETGTSLNLETENSQAIDMDEEQLCKYRNLFITTSSLFYLQ
jgi:hypothetical protein